MRHRRVLELLEQPPWTDYVGAGASGSVPKCPVGSHDRDSGTVSGRLDDRGDDGVVTAVRSVYDADATTLAFLGALP